MRLLSAFRRKYAPLSDGSEKPPILADFRFFFVSPLQIWLDGIISRVGRSGIVEDDRLPRFSCGSSYLRAVLRIFFYSILSFLCQPEIAGMLLLGAVLEVSAAQ